MIIIEVIVVLILISVLIFLLYFLIQEFKENYEINKSSNNPLLAIMKSANKAMENMGSYLRQGRDAVANPVTQIDDDLFIEGRNFLKNFEELKKQIGGIIGGVDDLFNYPLLANLLASVSPDSEKKFGKISGGYAYIISEDKGHPFQINPLISQTAQKIVAGKTGDKAKSEALYDWFLATIIYGDKKRKSHKAGYRTAMEVFADREGVCGEMAVLYVVMARSVGLAANYVSVFTDCKGEDVKHACAAIKLGQKQVLIDPAYATFGIKHKKYKVLTDKEAVPHFKKMRAN